MLKETAEERENRLGKCREAWKKKTAEAKGKQREYKRVYKQQKQAGESAEERETCLAKRSEVWQERTPELKGKRKEYKRVYHLDKLKNETEEGTNRLQKRKQDRATETVMSEQEYLKFTSTFSHSKFK